MPLERLNPKEIYQPFGNRYTQVIRTTGATQIHVAGIVPADKDGNLVGEGDVAVQTEVVMDSIGKALAAAGAKPSDVARMNIYVLDVDRYLQEGHRKLMDFFGDNLPVSTLIGVTRLANPGFLVEVEVTAVLDD